MPKASVKRLIECKKEQLIDLVLDIEKYPDFVPFCMDAKVHEKKELGGHIDKIWCSKKDILDAEQKVRDLVN